MKKQITSFAVAFLSTVYCSLSTAQNADSLMIKKISDEIFVSGECYKNLGYLCKKIGSRLTASAGAEKAVTWTHDLMKGYGFDKVYLQEVMVPHWVRGEKEIAKAINTSNGTQTEVAVTALGGSVATPDKGMRAEIIEVKDFEALKKLGKEKVKGKIVFYNHPFDITMISPFDMYGEAAKYRSSGAIEAAKLGAVASVTRSMTNYINKYPNTGGMRYIDTIPKIPACAISTQDAEWISAEIKKGGKIMFYLKMSCQTLPDVKSYNVIGEITGSQFPDEIIDIGGHLDSWDLAEGAHDDGAGVMQSIEVLRVLKKIGYKPKRTIRAVMFMNEENGLKGALEYAKQAELKKEKHILAIESDAGGFTPRGFDMSMSEERKTKVRGWISYFQNYGAWDFTQTGGGADIGPLGKLGTPLMGFSPDSQRYFLIHHTALDTFEQVNKRELEMGAIVMTMMVYFVSEYGL